MKTQLPIIPAAIAVAICIGCVRPINTPTSDSLPHNWLTEKITIEQFNNLRDRVLRAKGDPKAWSTLTNLLKDGDEIWKWEEPTFGNMYPPPRSFGCCIIRNNQIVHLLQIGTLGWVD